MSKIEIRLECVDYNDKSFQEYLLEKKIESKKTKEISRCGYEVIVYKASLEALVNLLKDWYDMDRDEISDLLGVEYGSKML